MMDFNLKEFVEEFVQTKSERDSPTLPNQAQPLTQHELIFDELNELVAVYKQLEHELRQMLETPLKLILLYRGAKNYLVN